MDKKSQKAWEEKVTFREDEDEGFGDDQEENGDFEDDYAYENNSDYDGE